MIRRSILSALVLIGLAAGPAAAAPPQPEEAPPPLLQLTPPRLAAVWGDVSFARPDEPEWSAAEVNTPLAPGDALSLGPTGTVEIQVGPRAFVRARPHAHLVHLGQQQPQVFPRRYPRAHRQQRAGREDEELSERRQGVVGVSSDGFDQAQGHGGDR